MSGLRERLLPVLVLFGLYKNLIIAHENGILVMTGDRFGVCHMFSESIWVILFYIRDNLLRFIHQCGAIRFGPEILTPAKSAALYLDSLESGR